MSLFTTLLAKLLPLYFMIFLGFLAARNLRVPTEAVGRLLIYLIAPVVVFYGAYTATLDAAHLSLPVLFFFLGSILSLLFLVIGTWVFGKDPTRNILAFAAGTGNTGYFGIPACIALFGDKSLSPAVLCILGVILYENSLGFFITANGKHTAGESAKKVIRLPSLYAFFAGILMNGLGFPLGSISTSTVEAFKGAYTLLGMMIVGMGLASVSLRHIDFKFILISHLSKFAAWPLAMLLIVSVDDSWTHAFDPLTRNVLLLLSWVPLAANTVAFAAEFDAHPDKAAVAVLISTVFALFFLPGMAGLLLRF